MHRLGISIYPNNSESYDIKDYIKLAAKYGFERIFTCLISASDNDIEVVLKEFKEILDEANRNKMEVIADIDPAVFNKLKASVVDLRVFKDIGLSGIRLDMGFSGYEESIMTYNEYGL